MARTRNVWRPGRKTRVRDGTLVARRAPAADAVELVLIAEHFARGEAQGAKSICSLVLVGREVRERHDSVRRVPRGTAARP